MNVLQLKLLHIHVSRRVSNRYSLETIGGSLYE